MLGATRTNLPTPPSTHGAGDQFETHPAQQEHRFRKQEVLTDVLQHSSNQSTHYDTVESWEPQFQVSFAYRPRRVRQPLPVASIRPSARIYRLARWQREPSS